MLGIHPVQRRLAEIQLEAEKVGSYYQLPHALQIEMFHCLRVNADIILKLDGLKELAYQAQVLGDMRWVQEVCQEIDSMESTMI